ncbi:kinase-like domain-containing protein [Gorgonomyces haynaldii]|nr:kinase-like domain-containing protein [Gorgonomyces haynaldii]
MRYQREALPIGKGASGTVYRALDLVTGSTVAVKVVESNPSELKDLMYEIDLLKQLKHRNIVQLYGFEYTKTLDIIMEYCEGGSLRHLIESFGKIPENLCCTYLYQITCGLEYLHQQGVIHRDVKAANVLVTKKGEIKLADFGIAVKQGTRDDFRGSPFWMAPEVIEMHGATTSSDIWSLGCTAIEMLTGSPPFYHLDAVACLYNIVTQDIDIPEQCSREMQHFLRLCFRRNVDDRPKAHDLLGHDWFRSQHKIQDQEEPTDIKKRLNQYREDDESGDYSMAYERVEKANLHQIHRQENENYEDLYAIDMPLEPLQRVASFSDASPVALIDKCLMGLQTFEILKFLILLEHLPSAPLYLYRKELKAQWQTIPLEHLETPRTILFYLVEKYPPDIEIEILKIMKNLCQVPQDYSQTFDKCDALETFCKMLSRCHQVQMTLQLFVCLFHLLRLDPQRQERAIYHGILTSLHTSLLCGPCAQFVIPLVCELVTGCVSFAAFWQCDILHLLVEMMRDLVWRTQSLEAIVYWHSREPSKVERVLLKDPSFTQLLLERHPNVELMAGHLSKFISQSPLVGRHLIQHGYVKHLVRLFESTDTAQTMMKLQRLVVQLLHPSLRKTWQQKDLELIKRQKWSNNQSVIVRELGNRIMEMIGSN